MKKTMRIRKGVAEDHGVIAQFNQLMAIETEGRILPDELIVPGVQAVLADPQKGQYYLAESDREVIGQLMITSEWSDWRNAQIWWIQSVYVREDHRGKGVYSAMYEAVRQDALRAGVHTIRLYVEKHNLRAQAVYRKLGMEESMYALYEVTLP